MSRRNNGAAEAAAQAASEAARTLQARQQEVRQERSEPATEPKPEPQAERPEGHTPADRVEKLLKGRTHTQAYDEIVKKRGLDNEPEAAEPAKEEKPASEAAPTETITAAPAEVTTEAAPPVKTVRVKVDGEEFDAPEEEVNEAGGLKAYQIQRASENRLKKASEAAASARQSQEQTAKLLQDYAARLQAQQPEVPKVSDQQFIAAKLDAVRFGSQEESAAALQEVIQRLTPKPIDQQAVIAQATNQMRHDHAVAEFDKEFSDVAKNPMALRLAVALRSDRLAKLDRGTQVDWSGFYRTIGTEVRNAFGTRPSQPAQQTDKKTGNTSQPSEKEARKASITTIPTAAARAAAPEPEKELSPEEERKAAIAAMKKARGQ